MTANGRRRRAVGRNGDAHLTRRTAHDALAVLRDESPAAYRAISEHLVAAPSLLHVGGEQIGLSADADVVRLRTTPPPAWRLEASLDAPSVVRLVDGTATIEGLMERGQLHIRGHPDALLAFLTATRVFSAAATRSSALQRLFERYREAVG